MAFNPRRCPKGFTLIEALILLVVLSIVAIAAGAALTRLADNPEGNDFQLAVNTAIVSKMEEGVPSAFTSLTVGTSLSDTCTINGTSYPRTVTIAQANPNGGGNVSSFLQITVAVNGKSITTLVSQP